MYTTKIQAIFGTVAICFVSMTSKCSGQCFDGHYNEILKKIHPHPKHCFRCSLLTLPDIRLSKINKVV